MARKKQDHAHWAGEWAYVASVDPGAPGKDFRHRPDVFAGYCEMQARFAEDDGFGVVARDMRAVERLAREHADAQALHQLGVAGVRDELERLLVGLDDLTTARARGLLQTVLGPDTSNHRRVVAETALGGLVVRLMRTRLRELLKDDGLG